MEESIFLDHIGNSPQMRVLQYLIEGRDFDYTMTDMLNSEVSWGTLNSLIPELLRLNIIIKTRKIGRASLYKINKENLFAQKLIELYYRLILENLNSIKDEKLEIASED